MEFLTELWLPIVLSAVFVWIASSILHMVITYHKSDYTKMSGEDEVLAALRGANVGVGNYMFPHCQSFKDMQAPEQMEKFKQGPVGTLVVIPSGTPNIGKSLMQWFVFCLGMSLLIAYVSRLAIPGPAEYMSVFRLTGAMAAIAYGYGALTESIWKGVRWSTSSKFVFDGLIYGLVTGGTFGWLWPEAAG